MRHPERQHVVAALEDLDPREWLDCLLTIWRWADGMVFVDPDDPTPAPAVLKLAAERELKRLGASKDPP